MYLNAIIYCSAYVEVHDTNSNLKTTLAVIIGITISYSFNEFISNWSKEYADSVC